MANLQSIINSKGKRKLTMLTAYDYPSAQSLSKAGIDILLVGDSLGMVVLGYQDTKRVTLEDMLRHASAVVRGNQKSFIVADLPFESCSSAHKAMVAAERLLKEAGVHAVKIEGDPGLVRRLVSAGIPVMGHTGLKPQTALRYGVKGKKSEEAAMILEEALELQKAGVFALVVECVPSSLAEKITKSVAIPTIGIGAGASCDGQVLVWHDMMGFYHDFQPRFVRKYADMAKLVEQAGRRFKNDVRSGNFPSTEETYL